MFDILLGRACRLTVFIWCSSCWKSNPRMYSDESFFRGDQAGRGVPGRTSIATYLHYAEQEVPRPSRIPGEKTYRITSDGFNPRMTGELENVAQKYLNGVQVPKSDQTLTFTSCACDGSFSSPFQHESLKLRYLKISHSQ